LKSVGVSEEQAEVHTEMIKEIISSNQIVSKQYLDLRLAELKAEIIKWMIGVAGAQVALIVALIKLI
jgi:hypothetical protein